MNPDNQDIKDRHIMGLKGVFLAYPLKSILGTFSFLSSLILTVIILGCIVWVKVDLYKILQEASGLFLGLFPNLLGFNLGGYALLVGFGNTDLLRNMTTPTKDNKQSIFQKLNGVFAVSLIAQFLSLMLSVVIAIFDKIDLKTSISALSDSVNLMSLGFLLLMSFWSLFLIPAVVLNVFTFGQMHHLFLTFTKKKGASEN